MKKNNFNYFIFSELKHIRNKKLKNGDVNFLTKKIIRLMSNHSLDSSFLH